MGKKYQRNMNKGQEKFLPLKMMSAQSIDMYELTLRKKVQLPPEIYT